MFSEIRKHLKPKHIGVYINPDEIEKSFTHTGILDFRDFSLNAVTLEALLSFLKISSFLEELFAKQHFNACNLTDFKIVDDCLHIPIHFRDSYFASIISDFIRTQLMLNGSTLTFESVMSSTDKIHILQKAKELGYRVYLYYISTVDPQINIGRVASRVAMNGHNVAQDKIISRYFKSLENLFDAAKFSYRAYFFDNSENLKLIAQLSIDERTEEFELEFTDETRPDWLQKYFLDKINKNG
ncbi:zeta toxin family protein [Aquella oligotrophica]|uniref:Zeta toxin domain-containing protein n=1 Tax=Aquella oligotrophica TaxID=2067065 RepID=A0A2I7N6K8_9NEIS|nr:zeta toxin family protein [Aquella oligotrophica]AUR52088.1 hypothetical protein CUN60_07165 [Aquella oligotrophica]